MCLARVGACRRGVCAHAAHEAQEAHARALMTGQLQISHVLMRMGCGDEARKKVGAYLLSARPRPTVCGVARHGLSLLV